jgi:uncharacterized repeat protein (TIGR01451 family)
VSISKFNYLSVDVITGFYISLRRTLRLIVGLSIPLAATFTAVAPTAAQAAAPDLLWVPPTLSPITLSVDTPSPVTLTVSNGGPGAGNSLNPAVTGTINVTLPDNVMVDGSLPAGCTVAPPPASFSCDVNGLDPAGSSLASTQSKTFSFNIVASAPTTGDLTAVISNVTAGNGNGQNEKTIGNNTLTVPLTATTAPPVPGSPDLAISPISGSSTLTVDESGTYVVSVVNQGTAASTGGTLTVTLPTGMTGLIDPASLPPGVNNCSANATNTVFTCDLGTIGTNAPDNQAAIEIEVIATTAFTDEVITAGIVNVDDQEISSNESGPITATLGAPPPVALGNTGQATPVPTLDEAGLVLLALLLVGSAAVVRMRRKG